MFGIVSASLKLTVEPVVAMLQHATSCPREIRLKMCRASLK